MNMGEREWEKKAATAAKATWDECKRKLFSPRRDVAGERESEILGEEEDNNNMRRKTVSCSNISL